MSPLKPCGVVGHYAKSCTKPTKPKMGRPTKSPATPSTLTPTPSPRPPPTNSGPTRTPIPHTDHTCPTCSKSFCGFQGWQYHTINKVCALRPSDRPPPLPKPTSCQRNSTCNKGYRHQVSERPLCCRAVLVGPCVAVLVGIARRVYRRKACSHVHVLVGISRRVDWRKSLFTRV